MANLETVVVALSGADGDECLISYAGMLARLGGTREVRFAHVNADGEAPASIVREQMRRRVAGLFQGPAHTECDVMHGPLTDRLLHYVTDLEADLILIGGKRRILGPRLAMVAPCSVAVIPEGAPAKLSHIMVAIDFSEEAAHTLAWAAALASGDRQIDCTALHVITRESVDLFADQESETAQAEVMRNIVARADHSGVPVTARLAQISAPDDVADTILSEAVKCGADCIAMSTRGRSASASILLGSVTEKVIARATVPLLVRKRPGSSLGLAAILLGRAGWRQGFKAS